MVWLDNYHVYVYVTMQCCWEQQQIRKKNNTHISWKREEKSQNKPLNRTKHIFLSYILFSLNTRMMCFFSSLNKQPVPFVIHFKRDFEFYFFFCLFRISFGFIQLSSLLLFLYNRGKWVCSFTKKSNIFFMRTKQTSYVYDFHVYWNFIESAEVMWIYNWIKSTELQL